MTTLTRSSARNGPATQPRTHGRSHRTFKEYLEENRDEIEALAIYFTQPARRSEVTYAMVKDVLAKLKEDRPRLAPLTVWRAYAHLDDYKGANPAGELTALVALIRRVCGLDATLTRHSDRVRRNFQDWILKRHAGAGEKFSEDANGLATHDPRPPRHLLHH